MNGDGCAFVCIIHSPNGVGSFPFLTAEDLEYEQKRAEEAADTEYNSDEEYEKLRHTEWQMAMSTYSESTQAILI